MIKRIWHGWTSAGNAGKYESLLRKEIFAQISGRLIKGYRGIELLKRELGGEVEFITIMKFDDLQAVKDFAGQDYEQAVVPEAARALLSRFDERSQHYQVIHYEQAKAENH